MKCISALVLCGVLMMSCATLKQDFASHEALLELAVKASTARVLAEKPKWRPEIIRITGAAGLQLKGGATPLGVLETYVMAQVPWDRVTPEEGELIRLVVKAIRQETEKYLADRGVANPEDISVVAVKVLGWVHEVAARPQEVK